MVEQDAAFARRLSEKDRDGNRSISQSESPVSRSHDDSTGHGSISHSPAGHDSANHGTGGDRVRRTRKKCILVYKVCQTQSLEIGNANEPIQACK